MVTVVGNHSAEPAELDPLTGRGTLPADGDAGARAAGSERDFVPPPAPPPPPQLSRKALRESKRELDRQLRSTTVQDLARRLKGVHRSWWWLLAGVGFALASVWFLKFLTSSLVDAATVDRQQQAPVSTVVQAPSMPNPFDRVKLSKQAAVFLGAHDTDGDGQVDSLDDRKSAVALTAILNATDLCGWWVTVDAQFQPALSRQATPGAAPLADCPTPPTTVAPVSTTTTAAPTTTAAVAK